MENFVETLLDLLQRYREKAGDKVAEKGGSIFTKACFLLALHLQDEHRAAVCRLLRRLKKIIKLNRKDCYYSCVNVTPFCFLFFFFHQEVMKLPKVLDRLRSIYRLTARKHKMDAERTIMKQKMNASINGSFFVQATPRKSRPGPKYVYTCSHAVLYSAEMYSVYAFAAVIDVPSLLFRFAPDWVLRKDKLKDIVDPLRAIEMVAKTLCIVL